MGHADIKFSPDLESFVTRVKADAERAFRILRETNTTTAFGTVGFVVRVPGEQKLVVVNDPGPWNRGEEIVPSVVGLDGVALSGKDGGGSRYAKLFRERPEVTIISHVHTSFLAAWAQTHRTFPINYVAFNRHLLIREIPVYIDRRQP